MKLSWVLKFQNDLASESQKHDIIKIHKVAHHLRYTWLQVD